MGFTAGARSRALAQEPCALAEENKSAYKNPISRENYRQAYVSDDAAVPRRLAGRESRYSLNPIPDAEPDADHYKGIDKIVKCLAGRERERHIIVVDKI